MKCFVIDIDNCCAEERDLNGLDDYYKTIGCQCVDFATRIIGGRPYVIVCDDEGLLKDAPVISAYYSPKVPALAGTLIVFNHDELSCDLAPLDDSDVQLIRDHVYLAMGATAPFMWPVLLLDDFNFA